MVCVLEEVILRVAVAVEVCVLEVRAVLVAAELVEEVLDIAAVAVVIRVGLRVCVTSGLREGSQVPRSERVDVVVFVDVLDWVDVDVGTRPPLRRIRSWRLGLVFHGLVATEPIAASNSSQRMGSTTGLYFKKFRCA